MFSDTHFHLQHIIERNIDGAGLLKSLAENGCRFALDIGTRCDDLERRIMSAGSLIGRIRQTSGESARRVYDMLYFSAGIWPAAEAVRERETQMRELRRQIDAASAPEKDRRIIAVGECGLDHYRNPSADDGSFTAAEADLFCMQLELAQRLNLPVIVHSRDAFNSTYGCIRDTGCGSGVIHCFSYGVKEARCFLDIGWYISFSGSITYGRKGRAEEVDRLLRFVPRGRMLVETDSPYLAPMPERGKTNTPLLIGHTYAFIASRLGINKDELSADVEQNIARLFGARPSCFSR